MKKCKTKQGFTIIEVVLVLAIAGLIFLMVFVAFPALQRNQRDAQRRQDVANFSANFKNAIANGLDIRDLLKTANTDDPSKITTSTTVSRCPVNGNGFPSDLSKTIEGLNYTIANANANGRTYTSLACKMIRYYANNTSTNTSTAYSTDTTEENQFKDPDGKPYSLYMRARIVTTSDAPTKMTGTYGWDSGNHYIVVFFNSECDGSKIKTKIDPAAYTIRYAMEDGSIYCQNSSL